MPQSLTISGDRDHDLEPKLRTHQARLVRRVRRIVLADHNGDVAEADVLSQRDAAAQGRLDLAAEIAAAMPLLTAEQREQLRPILAGTLPIAQADDSTAA